MNIQVLMCVALMNSLYVETRLHISNKLVTCGLNLETCGCSKYLDTTISYIANLRLKPAM